MSYKGKGVVINVDNIPQVSQPHVQILNVVESAHTDTVIAGNIECSEPVTNKPKVDAPEIVKRKSTVWEWFVKFKNDDGKDKAKCIYCKRVYAADPKRNGTSALRTHMLSLCPYRKVNSNQKLLSFTEKKEEGIQATSLKAVRFDGESCKLACAKMILVDELPFKFVENEGFKGLVKELEPRFHVPSRTTIAKYCMNLFVTERKNLQRQLKSERLCLTTDTWTSVQRYSYMCLTGHWIDKDWRLQKRILNFVRILDHTGEAIGNEIINCLSTWGVKKIFTITMDNASVNDVVGRHLKRKTKDWKSTILGHEFLQVRCSAHILNLIVKDGLFEFNESIEKIRLAIKYVKGSSQRSEKFKKCVVNAQISCKSLLCLDVETRWNSTYLMLETAIKFEKAFDGLEDELSYLNYFINDNKVKGPPTADDWENARLFVTILKLFYTVTLEVSGSKYPTSHLFFQNISMMEHMINSMCDSSDSAMCDIAQRMNFKFNKYWGSDSERNNMLLYVAFVLDPQCKLMRLKKCFNALYDPIKTREMVQSVESTSHRLYDHYASIMHPSQNQATNSQGQSSNYGKFKVEPDVQFKFALYQKKMFNDESEEAEDAATCTSELIQYLKEDTLKMQVDFDILSWWKVNSSRFTVLSQVARDVLSIPISTVASESAFSTGGRILDPFRSSLSPKTVEALVCGRDWLRCKTKLIDLEEMLDDVEKYEELDKELEVPIVDEDAMDIV